MENKKQNKKIKIKVPLEEYRAMKRALNRQIKAKRLIYELWLLYSNVK